MAVILIIPALLLMNIINFLLKNAHCYLLFCSIKQLLISSRF
jgi:hypothetical protein